MLRGLLLLPVLILFLAACSGASKPAAPVASPATAAVAAASPSATARPAGSPSPARSEEISFTSGADTLYGTLELPATAAPGQRLPGALIIAGSGPTDRDGNSADLRGDIGTLRDFADALAAAGVVSLRYDKIGAGKTGLGSYQGRVQDVGFDAPFVDSAQAALAYLASRPEVDPAHLLLLGHSEGGLIALVLAQRLQASGHVPALVLASPLPERYLDLLREQIVAQYTAAVQAGQISTPQAQASIADLNAIVDGLRQTGQVPAGVGSAALRQAFVPNAKFLYEADKYDPQAIAASLAPTVPVLVLWGTKDQQIPRAPLQALVDAFKRGGNSGVEYDELPNVDHVYKVVPGVPNPASDYTNPNLPFSQEAADRLTAFVRRALAAR